MVSQHSQTPAVGCEPLRQRAEDVMCDSPETLVDTAPEGLTKLVHELRVHQVELEMQNEELRRAQEDLQQTRDRYAELYDFAPVGYLSLDENGIIEEANLTAARMLGRERPALKGRKLAEFVAQTVTDQSIYYLTRRRVFESGNPHHCELLLQPSGGNRTWVQMDCAPMVSGGWIPTGSRVVLTSIEARKSAEETRDLLAKALDQTADAVIVTDVRGTVRYINAAFERLTGYTAQEVLSGSRHVLDSGRYDQSFYRQLRQMLWEKGAWHGRVMLRGGKQQEYQADESISIVRDESGEVKGYISVHRDVSEYLILERKLQQSHKLEALGTLAGGIAHDFNNILMAILGYADLGLQHFPEDTQIHQILRPIAQAGQRAAEVVQQILCFSRQEEEERRVVELSPVIQEVLGLLRASLPSTIEIRLDLNPRCGSVLADPARIHQVVMNLATNAMHAMRESGGVLEVSLQPVRFACPSDREREYLELSIRDTGPGMDKHLQARIFDPYFTTKKPGEGSGLGLAVVHGIVSALEGSITVESEVGRGSTFRVFLPVVGDTETVQDRKNEHVQQGSGRILLVDDEPDLVTLGEKFLTEQGYQVDGFHDGQAALEAFRNDPYGYDLIITDQTMPRLTGVELAQAVVSIRPEIPVLMCTGYSDLVNGEKAKEFGVSDFLLKPVRGAKLVSAVRNLLDSSLPKACS